AEPVRLATPDVGAVELSFLDDDGAPWRGPADVLLLVADADPSPDENVRRRRTARTVGGTARFEGVETGTLLLVEARPDDPRKLSAPLQVEGPSAEGATIRAVVRVTSRPPAAGGGAPRPRFVAPGLGPARVKPAPVGRGEGALLARCGPAAALPSWPYALEIGLAVAPDRAPETFSRCDEKGLARATLPAGRWWPRFRLWRAQPDGWLAVDVRSATPPPPITVEPGVERDASLTVDAAALEEAAAILAAP
ncbi:MAG TPA: hypothetical protein VEI02_02690, partial [Planctomycetota bacterium]|nr:hypothetical protein [Planctomycetota bacterium]